MMGPPLTHRIIWDVANRPPAYLVRGEFRPEVHQPIQWNEPILFVDNDTIP